MALENITDNLREGYSQLEKGSFQQVDQLHVERQDNPALRSLYFFTSDGQGYFLREDGGVDWAITTEDENLVLRHIDDEVNSPYDQLVQKSNYIPDNAEAQAAKSAEGTVVVDMTKLRLSGGNEKYRSLVIRTNDGFVKTDGGYQAPNEEEQKAMARLGYTSRTLKMLEEGKIAQTRILVPNPDHVKEKLKDTDKSSLWRASWLDDFYNGSSFDANGRHVFSHVAVRGVRKITEGHAPKNQVPQEITPKDCYKTLLADRETAVAAMDDTTAAGLSAILADYLATKAE